MSVVSIRDLIPGARTEPDTDDRLIVQWAESLVAKAVKVRQLFGSCSVETARFLVGPAERRAKEVIEFVSDPAQREELLSRLTSRKVI